MPYFQNRNPLFYPSPIRPNVGNNLFPAPRFGFDTPLPTEPVNQPPPDFATEYGRINSARPNRLAYQQAVEQGSPEIKRGKWAKLGALITAGAAGAANPRDPGGAYNLAMSAYEEPQRRADEDYNKRLTGLGNLAQFEESDKANEIRALEARQSDYYRSEENKRQNAAEVRAKANEARQEKLTDEQIANYRADNERQNWLPIEDKTDGNTYLYNRVTKEKRLVAKTDLTTAEQLNQYRDRLAAEYKIKEPYEIQKDLRERKTRMDVATETTNRMREQQGEITKRTIMKAMADAQKASMALKAKAAKLDPKSEYQQVFVDLTEAINQGLLPANAGSYIDVDDNGVITANKGWTGDKDTEDSIKELIANSINKSKAGLGGGGSNQSTINETPTNIERDANNPQEKRGTLKDGTVVYSHDGGKTWGKS